MFAGKIVAGLSSFQFMTMVRRGLFYTTTFEAAAIISLIGTIIYLIKVKA